MWSKFSSITIFIMGMEFCMTVNYMTQYKSNHWWGWLSLAYVALQGLLAYQVSKNDEWRTPKHMYFMYVFVIIIMSISWYIVYLCAIWTQRDYWVPWVTLSSLNFLILWEYLRDRMFKHQVWHHLQA